MNKADEVNAEHARLLRAIESLQEQGLKSSRLTIDIVKCAQLPPAEFYKVLADEMETPTVAMVN